MTMKLRLALATLVMALAGIANQAEANIVFTIENATMVDLGGNDAGMLTGTFTTDDAITTLIDYNITAPATSGLSNDFPGYVYTPATTSLVIPFLPYFFQVVSTNADAELLLTFESPLTAGGASLATDASLEHELGAGLRFFTGGSVTVSPAVPEPSSVVMLGTAGVFGLGALARRRRKSA
jgi:hypothetical protein